VKEVLSLHQAVLATIHYFDLLDFPLTLEELEEYLYGRPSRSEAKKLMSPKGESFRPSRSEAAEEIAKLPGVQHAHGFYFLEGRDEIAELRKERQKIAKAMWQRTERFRFLFALCPYVRMVAVCNTLAYGNVKETSDIDLFIITKDGKLATARFFMKLFTQLFGVRVHHDKISSRFCLSFFVTERASNLKPLAHAFDPHLAYFVTTAVPIFGEFVYRDWLKANEEWAAPYFKRPLSPRIARLKENFAARFFRFFLESFLFLFGNWLENFFYEFQMKRDRERQKKFPYSKGIVINRNVFKFHESDPREEIAKKFLERQYIE
jgi:hypothetical protein